MQKSRTQSSGLIIFSAVMKIKPNKTVAVVIIVILVVIVLLLVYDLDYYPAALVGTGFISQSNWKQALALGQKLNPSSTPDQISSQLIKIKEEKQLVSSLKIPNDNVTFESEFKYLTTGKDTEYKNLLANYFSNNEALFKEFVVKPKVYDALLRVKYNSDFSFNKIAYEKAQGILTSLKNGKKFEELAASESDDEVSGQFGGDLGFVASGQLLPEIELAISQTKVSEVYQAIVISRLGYHILYPVEIAEKDGQKLWHLKHILITTDGFDNWLNPMLNRFLVWRLK